MMKTTIYGTGYFPSIEAAVRYYLPYENNDAAQTRRAVEGKIGRGDIHVGKPLLKEGQKCYLHAQELRYFIESETA